MIGFRKIQTLGNKFRQFVTNLLNHVIFKVFILFLLYFKVSDKAQRMRNSDFENVNLSEDERENMSSHLTPQTHKS